MSYVPREPSGNDAESHFMKWVWRMCRRVFADSPTVKWDLTDAKASIAHALPPSPARARLRVAVFAVRAATEPTETVPGQITGSHVVWNETSEEWDEGPLGEIEI